MTYPEEHYSIEICDPFFYGWTSNKLNSKGEIGDILPAVGIPSAAFYI